MSAAPKVKKSKAPADHPPVADMIKAAIVAHKDRKGTSLATIKKHIASAFKVDMVRMAPHIRRGIVHGVASGALVRVGNKGQGASGSFKIAEKAIEKKPKVAKAKKPAAPKKVAAEPKVAKPKATPKKKAPAAVAKPKVAKAKATPKKKAPAAPKPKVVKPKKPAAPKKAAAAPKPKVVKAKKPAAKKAVKA